MSAEAAIETTGAVGPEGPARTPHWYYLGDVLIGLSVDEGVRTVWEFRRELAESRGIPAHAIKVETAERGA